MTIALDAGNPFDKIKTSLMIKVLERIKKKKQSPA